MSGDTSTRQQRFLPYRFEDLGIDVRIEGCWLDGRPTKIAPDAERHVLDLSAQQFGRVTLALVATVPGAVLASVLSPAELLAPPTKVLVLVRCAATRLRTRVELNAGASAPLPLTTAPASSPPAASAAPATTHTGELTLARGDLRGSVEITGLLVRAGRSIDREAGRAAEANLRLASARPWELRIDAGPPPPGDYLDIRQEDFRMAGPVRFPEPDALYHLDFEAEAPILWINSGHRGIAGILHSTASTGRAARLRDAIFERLEAVIWPRLFLRAARALHPSDELSFAWQAAVLRRWLPALYPQCGDHEGQLFALSQELATDEGTLLDRLDLVLQRDGETARHLDLLLQVVEP